MTATLIDTTWWRPIALLALLAIPVTAAAQTAARPAAGRTTVPTADQQREAEARLRVRYQEELKRSTVPSKKAELARKIFNSAAEANVEAIDVFARLKMACQMAAEAGDVELIAQSIDAMARRFDIDALALKRTLLMRAASNPPNTAVAQQVARACAELMDEAAAEEQFDEALVYGRAAHTAAGAARQASLVGEIVARGRAVVAQKEQCEEARKAAQLLSIDPDDAEANLVCGRYVGLVRGDWARGLPMLAKGEDAGLRSAAQGDLAGPSGPAEQLAVADAWWELAEAATGPAEKALRGRAATWYRKAQPDATGAEKAKATRRLAQSRGFGRPAASRPVAADDRPGGDPTTKTASKTLKLPRGTWTNLLGRIDPKKHRVAGNWQLRDGKLLAAPQQVPAVLTVPVAPGSSYDLQVEFTRTAGDGPFGLVLPVGKQACLAALDCRPAVHGLDMIDGHRADDNQSTARGALTTGRKYRLDVSVSVDGTEASITVNLDDRPLFFYRGPVAALSLAKEFKAVRPTALAVAARCGLVLENFKLRAKSDEAAVLGLRPTE